MTLISQALETAAAQGIGSGAANTAASHLRVLALQVREYAATASKGIGLQEEALFYCARTIASSQTISWASAASNAYNDLVRNRLNINENIRERLEQASAQTLQAGENIAQRLEELAALAQATGAVVDAVISGIAENTVLTSVLDILHDGAVTAAQAALDAILRDPLIAAVEQQLQYSSPLI